MMKKLSINIDMGAKYNGIFIVKSDDSKIIEKSAKCIVIDKNSINFSKVSRRANRHKVRNIKRRKLAKRLLWEILDKENYTKEQQESIQGLLNNRGYTYLSSDDEFDKLQDETMEFFKIHFQEFQNLQTKDDFLEFLSSKQFSNEKVLLNFLNDQIKKLEIEYKKKKAEFYKEFKETHSIIKKDLKILKEFFINIQKEINTGAKPRVKYFDDIKQEIQQLDFIKNRENFFNLIGNISNLQLRVLRKYFNGKFDDIFDDKKLYKKLNDYFRRFHNKEFEAKVFGVFSKYKRSREFLQNCNPIYTIPPYEDMNNRDTYKCNSMLIKDTLLANSLKRCIDKLLQSNYFEILDEKDLGYAQKLQRILDINSKIIPKEIYPRNVFKYQKDNSNIKWYQDILKDDFSEFSNFAKNYYLQEEKVIGGIYDESFVFQKCNTNTPYKNNIKHTLLKTIYSYEFSKDEADKFLQDLKNSYGLQASLKRISEEAKKYQNSFYAVISACFENKNCVDDKEIKTIVKNLDKNLQEFKAILKDKDTYLSKTEKIDSANLKRVLNTFKQTYEILFDDISGFSKTCRNCTKENSIRSKEDNPIAKRILSDVAKPIDGMLDMILDRIAWEIVKDIKNEDVKDIDNLEFILEQNRFEFEENLRDIKKASNPQVKSKKREYKDSLNINICPYTGKKFDKGDWDHILPRSKEIYNSKANLIYVSTEGNQIFKKSDSYILENLSKAHLKVVFKTEDLDEIKKIIKTGVDSIEKDKFTNFNNLKLNQQIALRYALFMKGTDTFKKAFEIVKLDKLKTISNGTQKRLARLIQEKFIQKFPKLKININSKVIDNKQISATRKELSINKETGEVNHLFKMDIQDTHSHCIDAMVAFYLANDGYSFEDIYVDNSTISNVTKSKTYINSNNIKSYKLFQDTVYGEHYKHFTKDKKIIDILIEHKLLYINKNNKKIYIEDKNQIESIAKIDIKKLSDLLFEAFNHKNEKLLKALKPLDKKRYNTTRADIVNIFYTKNKLKPFGEIKNIPPYQEKTYRAVYKVLQNLGEFSFEKYYEEMSKFFKLQYRKRGKKRHIFSLPSLGQNAKFRIKRGDQIDIVGSDNIATKTYLVDGKLLQIPYFSKNVIPLKIIDLLNIIKLNEGAKVVYKVEVDVSKIQHFIQKLTYRLTEASRLTIEVTLIKNSFDIDFDKIKEFNGSKDKEFKNFLQNYIQNKNSEVFEYIGSIRDALEGKAILLNNSKDTITLQYKADTNSSKKNIILNNL